MDFSSRRRTFVERCLAALADPLGYHPVAMVMSELAPFAALADHALLRRDPEGYWQMLLLSECGSPEELARRGDEAAHFATERAELTQSLRLRIALVGIGEGKPARRDRTALLRETRLLDDRVVIRRFYLSLDERRLYASRTPWSFAPGFQLNPVDPDDNLFVALVRKDRYLKASTAPGMSEQEHRVSLTKERTFQMGLSGGRLLVRTILAVNILVWLAVHFTGGSENAAQIIRAGAKSNGLIHAGEYWRFVTPIFLHFGLLHLVINSLGLLFLGEILERIYGRSQFALVYFVAGIASVAASYLYGQELMVGASGAIFGLAGALVVYGYRYRGRIPSRYGAMFGAGLLPLIGINIAFGALVKGVDNWAHLGGLVAGAAVALALRPLADQVTPDGWFAPRRVASLAVLGVVLGAAAIAADNFVRHPSIYDTDARRTLPKAIPGGLTLQAPATWLLVKHSPGEDVYESPCYRALLDARSVDASKDAGRVVLGEFARLQHEGFAPVGPAGVAAGLLGDLFTFGRVEALLQGPKGLQRRQTFLLVSKRLVSVGLETPEDSAAAFAPVAAKILSTLPAPQ